MITRRRRRRVVEQKPRIYMFVLSFLMIVLAGVGAVFTFVTLSSAGSAYAVYDSFAQQLPDPTAIETEQEEFETTKIYDRTGKVLLYELFDPLFGDRSYVELQTIPEFCREATIILEDKTFYENAGFDPEGIARAFVQNLQGGPIQGGSSITQQLIKNILIEEEERNQKSYTRKVKELILSTEITRRFEKDQILEWYFNTNFYGNLAYGIDAAARVYFDKPVSALTEAECAMLAPIPQFPYLNPINSDEQAKYRQRITLNRMVEEGAITQDEADAFFAQELDYRKEIAERFDIIAPHFAVYVREQLEKRYEQELIYRGGLSVYTTLDLELNQEAEKIAREQIKFLQENDNNAHNACVVSIRPKTGEILAMVGSVDYWDEDNDGNVNVCAADPGRQPGSSFKPFGYMTLFEQGRFNAASMMMDVRQSFPDDPNPPYVPENYDRSYHGPVRLRDALARSYNIPAVWVLHKAGVKNTIDMAHRMGITTLNADYYGLALVLGGGEVKPIDMAYAYSTLANMGTMAGTTVDEQDRRPGHRQLDPVSILRIDDARGNTIYQYTEPENVQVIEPTLAFLMNDILSDNDARAPAFGIASDLKKDFEDRPIAAKTGTTNNFRDNWTVGYTPQLATAVWVGNNDNEEMENVTGLSGAAPIWHDVMLYYHRDKSPETWPRPEGIVEYRVDNVSGLLPSNYTNYSVTEIFIEGTHPKTADNIKQAFQINRENGKLATANTPPELIENRVYEIYPSVAEDWARENGIPQPPTEYDDSSDVAVASGPVALINPRPYAYLKGTVPITGNANPDGFQMYRLEYGRGLNPSEWLQLGEDKGGPVANAPLEYWDTEAEREGLYTLQLTVLKNDQSVERKAVQVTIDNTAPIVQVINPEKDKQYEDDEEWVNIQVEARDNFSMEKVEFYVDNKKVGETTVAPFTFRWNIDRIRKQTITYEDPVTATEEVFDETTGITETKEVIVSQVLTITKPIVDPAILATWPEGKEAVEVVGYQKVFSGGFAMRDVISGDEYIEGHLIHVKAFDEAGNETESNKIPISIIPEKPKEKDDEEEVQAEAPAEGG